MTKIKEFLKKVFTNKKFTHIALPIVLAVIIAGSATTGVLVHRHNASVAGTSTEVVGADNDSLNADNGANNEDAVSGSSEGTDSSDGSDKISIAGENPSSTTGNSSKINTASSGYIATTSGTTTTGGGTVSTGTVVRNGIEGKYDSNGNFVPTGVKSAVNQTTADGRVVAVDNSTIVTLTDSQINYIEEKFLKLVNAERTSKGLVALKRRVELDKNMDIRCTEVIQPNCWWHERPANAVKLTSFLHVFCYGVPGDEDMINVADCDVEEYLAQHPNAVLCGEDERSIGAEILCGGKPFFVNNPNAILSPTCSDKVPLAPYTGGFYGTQAELDEIAEYMFTQFKNSARHYKIMMIECARYIGIGVIQEDYPQYYDNSFGITVHTTTSTAIVATLC